MTTDDSHRVTLSHVTGKWKSFSAGENTVAHLLGTCPPALTTVASHVGCFEQINTLRL